MRIRTLLLSALLLLVPAAAMAKPMAYEAAWRKATHAARVAGRAGFRESQADTMKQYRFTRPSYRFQEISVLTPNGPARVKLYAEVWAQSGDTRGRIRVLGSMLDITVRARGAARIMPSWLYAGMLATPGK